MAEKRIALLMRNQESTTEIGSLTNPDNEPCWRASSSGSETFNLLFQWRQERGQRLAHGGYHGCG
jgi:hypothetical protein